ncbi:MAG: ABC transporter substrate-binding protein [Chloroflexi bacterium]|nr:ABC transporter substrate-binding protein [Chloroflexota bacterium]
MTKKFGMVLILLMALGLLLVACGDNTATSSPTIGAAPNLNGGTVAPGATTALSGPKDSGTSAPSITTVAQGQASSTLAKVSLSLDWVPNTNHTGIYVAQQKGWYKEAGIDLQILPYADGASPETVVGAGKADFGISSTESLVQNRALGQPLVSVAAIIQSNTSGFGVLKDSNIKRPKDLAGKRYAGYGTSTEEALIAEVIKKDGGTDTKIQNITTNIAGYQAVASKQADFVWIFQGWEGIQAQRDKVELNVFFLKDIGIPDYYTPTIIANEDFLKNKKEVASAFMKATARGFEFAISNPKEAADLLIQANPKGTFPDPELIYQSQNYLSPRYKENAPKWGLQTLKAWTDMPKFMFQSGILKDINGKPLTKEPEYNKLFTNDLLPQ